MSNILIIDDQPYLRELFSHELVKEAYQVWSAADAESVGIPRKFKLGSCASGTFRARIQGLGDAQGNQTKNASAPSADRYCL